MINKPRHIRKIPSFLRRGRRRYPPYSGQRFRKGSRRGSTGWKKRKRDARGRFA